MPPGAESEILLGDVLMATEDNTPNTDNDDLPGANNPDNDNASTKTSTDKNSDVQRLENKIKELRNENAKYRTRAKDNEKDALEFKEIAKQSLDKIDELEKTITQKLSDTEKKILETEKKIELSDRRTIQAKLELEAKNAGVVDYEVFSKLVDPSSLSISESGEVKGVTEVVKALKESKPFLFDSRTMRTTTNLGIPQPSKETRVDRAAQRKENPKSYKQDKMALIKKYS